MPTRAVGMQPFFSLWNISSTRGVMAPLPGHGEIDIRRMEPLHWSLEIGIPSLPSARFAFRP